MDLQWSDGGCEARFASYVEGLSGCLGHADRVAPMRSYCTGLLLPGGRKSVEPMAARLRPDRTSAEHQSLLHFVGQSPWDADALLRRVREAVLPAMTARGAVEAWIVDDTGFPKKGRHSVGVARQYCGQLGKQDNCQAAVSLSVATAEASLPVAWDLYLTEGWAGDGERRARTRVPEDVVFRTKPRIALAQIETALAEGVAPGTVLADAGYGNNGAFRDGITALGLDYVVGVVGTATVWPPGTTPTVPAWRGRGQRPKRLRRGGDGAPVTQLRVIAETLPAEAWRAVTWRHGVAELLASRFAALRVRAASGDAGRSEPRPEQWLLVEWPEDEPRPIKFWFSSLPVDTPIERLGPVDNKGDSQMRRIVIQDCFLQGGSLDSHSFVGRAVGSDQGFGSGQGHRPWYDGPGQPAVRGGGAVGSAHGGAVARPAGGGRQLEQHLPALLALVEGRGVGESFQGLSR